MNRIEDYIDARMREAFLAFRKGLRAEAERIRSKQENCPHEVTTQDICNVGTCIACGLVLRISYSELDRMPTGEYWGISRTANKIR